MQEKQLYEILTPHVIAVSPTASVVEAMSTMERHRISCVLVIADGRPIGILTERKVVMTSVCRAASLLGICQVQEIMSAPVITAEKNMTVDAAYNLMAANTIRHLVVVDQEMRAVGVLTLSNILEHLGYEYFVEMRKTASVMTRKILTLSRETRVDDVVKEMAKRCVSCLVITEEKRPVGILTERDIIRLLLGGVDCLEQKVEEVMSNPVRTVLDNSPVLEAAETMRREKIRRVVVVDQNGSVVGVATQSNIVQGLESQYIQYLKRVVKEKELALEKNIRQLFEKSTYFDNILRTFTDIGIVSTDRDGRIVYYNPAAEQILEYPAKEAMGRDLREIHLKQGADQARLDAVLGTSQHENSRSFFLEREKNSGKQYLEARVTEILDREAKHAGYIFTLRDVTERRLAEEQLRVSEVRFRLSFENAKDAIFWANIKTGIIINCNKAAQLLLEKEREEIIGQPHTSLHPPEDAAFYHEMFLKDVERGGSIDNEGEVFTKSGKRIAVSITASKTMIGTESIIQGIFRDISERKLVEAALRESEKKYASLVEDSLTGIYINQEEKIVFANKRFAEIFGYRREELRDIEIWELVHPEDRDMTNRMRADRLSGLSVPSEYEARGLTKSGKTIWVKRRNTRITYDGKPAILGNVVDITERKKAEERLRALNEELKDFIRVVSHDLKSPLVAIQGFSARLAKKQQALLDKEGIEALAHIRANAFRMDLLISDLLTLEKMGHLGTSLQEISTGDIINQLIPALQHSLDEKGIRLVVADNLPRIRCSGQSMHQVFENLLTNAIKYMGNNGAPRIEIGYEDKEDFHQFVVRDNGVGIDQNYHSEIFEKFRRLESAQKQEGTGLGLAIVKRILANHGGRIWIESEVGKGAAFYFTLPKGEEKR